MSYLIAVDTGGTFTDLVAYDRVSGEVHFRKTLTDHSNLVEGAIACAKAAGLDLADAGLVKHGTTHVINALIQRCGAKTALVTTEGFRDLLELRRTGRPISFDLTYKAHAPLVPRNLRLEVHERIGADGTIITPLNEAQVRGLAADLLAQGVESVAVSLFNAYINPVHEERTAQLLREVMPEVYVTCGTAISREWYEFERTSTAVANAYVGPSARHYVQRFGERLREAGFRKRFFMMASNGGVLTGAQTVSQPISLIESGPIGGCIGAGAYSRALGRSKMVAFDMGGTTAKCAIINDGRFDVLSTYHVEGSARGFPVRANVLDIVEVGAGGGSIASITPQGRLLVGPRSAGSEPGPAAYGRGGIEPTVTDANLVLGRIGGHTFLGGGLELDRDAAARAIMDRVGRPLGYDEDQFDQVALGIIKLVNISMSGVIKEVTIERGLDVRDFDLFVFGGGGPLHGAALARELGMRRVIVPREPGNFSALGMLMASPLVNTSRIFLRDLSDAATAAMSQVMTDLEATCARELKREHDCVLIRFERQAEMRYKGQHHTLRLAVGEDETADSVRLAFDQFYKRRYGHSEPECPIEMVALHVTGHGDSDQVQIVTGPIAAKGTPAGPHGTRSIYFAESAARLDTPLYRRAELPEGFEALGPAVVEEYGSTVVIGPKDRFEIGRFGEIWIHCGY